MTDCFLMKLAVCYSSTPALTEDVEKAKVKHLGLILEYDELSFLSFYWSLRQQMKPQNTSDFGVWTSLIGPIVRFGDCFLCREISSLRT